MIIGHSLPVVVQAFIFVVVVQVDPTVLVSLIAVSVLGSWLGVFSVLGMDPRAAFPIMMGSGAMMAMAGGLQFMKAGRFDRRAALGLTLGGIPGVLVAGLLVRALPVDALRWVVVVVVGYAAIMMLRSALRAPVSAAQPVLVAEI